MTKAAKVTNSDPTNGAKVTWADSRTGPWHNVVLNPGEAKTVDPIATATFVKIEPVSGNVAVIVENVGTTNLGTRIPDASGDLLTPGQSASYTIDEPYGYLDVVPSP